jgi:outer membrane biosynthesis protein TonB
LIACGALALTFNSGGVAQEGVPQQQAAPAPDAQSQPAAAQTSQTPPTAAPAEPQPATAPAPVISAAPSKTQSSNEPPSISEDALKKMLVGKQLFLRGGYLDNALSFNEHGALIGHSAQGSYTLNAIEIDKVHIGKHKVELEGERYGLHFLGAMPYEDPTKAVDRVKVTPPKKSVKITIDRELVIKPKQEKEKGKGKASKNAPKPAAAPAAATAPSQPAEPTDANEAQAEIAAAPAAERPADPTSVTTTTSPAHANKVLTDALENIFAQPFDARMMAAMPDFWKRYYEAAEAKTDYRPKDPAVLRQSAVDQKARLVSPFEPASNQFAQDNGVAGMSLYHVVIGADGKPGEIAVARPIGFGLDESAVDSIRKATFAPAIKDGKPVPVLLDLVVEFRIYSKRTAVTAEQQEATDSSAKSVLPGPYSVEHQ